MKSKISLVLLSLGLWACSSDEKIDGIGGEIIPIPVVSEVSLTSAEKDLSHSINAFGIDFFTTATKDKDLVNKNPNFFFSPLSLSFGMSLFANTIDDENSAIFYNALGAESIEDLNRLNRKLMTYLPDKSNQESLGLVNALWYKPGISPSQEYQKIMEEYYFSKPGTLDFSSVDAITAINRWSAKYTNNMIPKLVESLDPATEIFLANALYFNAKWRDQFNKSATKDAPFYANKKEYTIQMMNKKNFTAGYYKDEKFETLTMHYIGNCVFFAVLPSADSSIDAFLKSFDYETFRTTYNKQKVYDVTVNMPKFSADTELNCSGVLSNMGLDINAVRFTGFNNKINKATHYVVLKQKNSIIVDEEGTVAASVTSLDMVMAPPPKPHVDITFNRPFIYMIFNLNTGSVLLMGQFTNPEK